MLYVVTMWRLLDKVNMMSLKLSVASIVGALCLATSASAATCSVNTVHFTLEGATGAQCMAGDDLSPHGIVAQNLNFFNLTDWVVGDSTVAGVGDGFANFLDAPEANATSGSWSLASFTSMGSLMIVLKSGHQFGAFLLSEATDSLSGTWNITRDRCNARGICTTIGKQLSHASVYYNLPAAVPVPAAGFMLLGGLGGLAALRRKRKAA